SRVLVDEADEGAVFADGGAEMRVLGHEALDPNRVIRLDAMGGAVRRSLDHRIVHDLATCEADRVYRRGAAAAQRVRALLDLGEVPLGVLVDEPDRRAGEDVVELLQEEQLPEPIELLSRVRSAAREELGIVQCLLAASVAALRARL